MGGKDDELGFRLSSKRLPKAWTQRVNRGLDRLFGFAGFNAAFRPTPDHPDSELVQPILDAIDVRVEASEDSKRVIPRVGALVVVCNHPFGVVDGLAIIALLQSLRPDVSAIVAHWFAQIPRLRKRFLIVVAAQGARRRRRQSVGGWLTALQRLKGGEAVIVFPAGQAARFDWRRLSVADLPWSPHVARVIRKTSAGVIPVYFPGRNSRLFYGVTAVLPRLANFLLASEFMKMRGARLRLVVGQPIAPAELARFATDEEMIQFLRRQIEVLRSQVEALAG